MLKKYLLATLFVVLNACINLQCNNDSDYYCYESCVKLFKQTIKIKQDVNFLEKENATLEEECEALQKKITTGEKEERQLTQKLKLSHKKNQQAQPSDAGYNAWISCCTNYIKDYLSKDRQELNALIKDNSTLKQHNAKLKQDNAKLKQEQITEELENTKLKKSCAHLEQELQKMLKTQHLPNN
jgi:uncharacterized protein YaaN involved in tellurite resistance